jgi:hypothetical protein
MMCRPTTPCQRRSALSLTTLRADLTLAEDDDEKDMLRYCITVLTDRKAELEQEGRELQQVLRLSVEFPEP